MQRLYTPEQTIRLAEIWREEGRSIVFTNGCFDLLHAGHLHLFNEALHRGDRLIVAVNCDEYVRSHKGPGRPVQPATVRATMVALMSAADAVTVFGEDTPERLLVGIQPDQYVLGNDYREGAIAGAHHCGRVVLVERLAGFSTSGKIRQHQVGSKSVIEGDTLRERMEPSSMNVRLNRG